jgi:hypothetical protein
MKIGFIVTINKDHKVFILLINNNVKIIITLKL